MALGGLFSRTGQHVIVPVSADDAQEIAQLHSDGFGRPWSDGEFASLLAKETVFGFAAKLEGKPKSPPDGFVLARLTAGEAEILTIAVAGSKRGKGLGRALMDAVLRHLHSERADTLFLEVSEDNKPALALYKRLGFAEVGRRDAYYGRGDASNGTALILRLDLK